MTLKEGSESTFDKTAPTQPSNADLTSDPVSPCVHGIEGFCFMCDAEEMLKEEG